MTTGDAPLNADLLTETERFLHEKIPITRAMGVRVERFDEGQFVLVAPIEKNHNHLHTAFGGSLSAVATLAGYGFLWLALHDPEVHVVIKESAIKFRRPVHGDIRAICRKPEDDALKTFERDFARKGKARITLNVEIVEDEQVAVEFQGAFVAIRHNRKPDANDSAPDTVAPP